MKLPNATHMETVCCIGSVGTFSAAAACLNTTQSAISARVREVESLLGVSLFQRSGRSVGLTLDGRRFVEAAQPLLQQLHDFTGSFKDAAGSTGRIRIGVGNTGMRSVAAMLRTVRQAMPRLDFDLETRFSGRMARALEQGELDLAVFTMAPADLGRYRIIARSLGLETLQWLIAPSLMGPTRTRRANDVQAMLDRYPLWCVPRPTWHFELALDSLRSRGATIRRLNTCNNLPAMAEIVLAGAGIGLLTDHLTEDHRRQGGLIPAFGRHGGVGPPPLEFFVACAADRQNAVLNRIMDVAVSTSRFKRQPAARNAPG